MKTPPRGEYLRIFSRTLAVKLKKKEELMQKRGERVGFETVVRKFLTHQEIANITATSRQTVTTVLNDLRSRDIILLLGVADE